MAVVPYSADELAMIRAGVCPPGRSLKNARAKSVQLGCPWPSRRAPEWTEAELECLRRNVYPATRSRRSCWVKAYHLGIDFHPSMVNFREQRAKVRANIDAILDEVRRTGRIRATARKFGVSYTVVSDRARAAGITFNPTPQQRRGESIEWGGSRWVWVSFKKGLCCYWRETSLPRRNLARVIYEQAFGPIPSDYCIWFKNGDHMDLRTENLEAVTRAEFNRRQRLDPMVSASMIAGGTLGRLNRSIKENVDPSLLDARMKKSLETRKKRRSHASL